MSGEGIGAHPRFAPGHFPPDIHKKSLPEYRKMKRLSMPSPASLFDCRQKNL